TVIWNVPSFEAAAAPVLAAGWIHSATFSPDGTRVITGDTDGRVAIMALPPRCQAAIDAARKSLPRELGPIAHRYEFLEDKPPAPRSRWLDALLPKSGDRCE